METEEQQTTMEVHVWGSRGSIAAPGPSTIQYGGNTTCVEVRIGGTPLIVIDAGTGIRPLGQHLVSTRQSVECLLLITHIHWDHILGFPFFSPIYRQGTHIKVDGCARALKGLRLNLDNRMVDGLFPVNFDDLPAKIEHEPRIGQGPLRLGEVEITAVELQHPQGGMGFRFVKGGKSFVFLTDNELWKDAWPGQRSEDYARFCEGADLLFHDAQYSPEEVSKKRGWGHSDWKAAVDLALQAGAAHLVLFHHDPDRTDEEIRRMEEEARLYARSLTSCPPEVEAAREGMSYRL